MYLSDERNDSLCAVLVHVRQIDLITEQHQPLAQLDRGEDHTIGGTAVLAVMIKGFQQQLWGGRTGEVQADDLEESFTTAILAQFFHLTVLNNYSPQYDPKEICVTKMMSVE